MDRESAVHALESVGAIEKLLDDCPHGVVKKIKEQLALFEEIAHGAFPGGYAGRCIYCEDPMGADEAVSVGDETCCSMCWAKIVAEMRNCAHTLEDATDEHGDPGRHCQKCGYFEGLETAPARPT